MNYEEGLADLFEQGNVSINHMVLAHIGGLGHRLPTWLARATRADRADERKWWRLFEALLTGHAESVEAVLRRDIEELPAARREQADRSDTPVSVAVAVEPLALLGRGDVVAALHANALRRRDDDEEFSLTVSAALSLARASDWTHAIEILELARRTLADIPIWSYQEDFLFTYAYLHREVERAMPVLAQMPFEVRFPNRTEHRIWESKAYQIRAGLPGIDVPVIEGEQPNGYSNAVAMLIAAIEDDPASAERVDKLRRVLQPTTTEMIYVDGGVSLAFDPVKIAVSKATACIAATRKDYAKAAALARIPSHNSMIEPATHVINAFLEEGDWRGAADIAKEHDPRKKKLIEGLEDDRAMQYVRLHVHLAIAAAFSGDDVAAAAFLDRAEEVDRTEVERDEDGVPESPHFLSLHTLLAGAAEGLLPRRYLHLLGPELYLVG